MLILLSPPPAIAHCKVLEPDSRLSSTNRKYGDCFIVAPGLMCLSFEFATYPVAANLNKSLAIETTASDLSHDPPLPRDRGGRTQATRTLLTEKGNEQVW